MTKADVVGIEAQDREVRIAWGGHQLRRQRRLAVACRLVAQRGPQIFEGAAYVVFDIDVVAQLARGFAEAANGFAQARSDFGDTLWSKDHQSQNQDDD
jgi:hypothetical protein